MVVRTKQTGPDLKELAVVTRGRSDKIASDLRGQIDRGDLRAGSAVPTERTLAETYEVTRDTVRRALAQLEAEGLLDPGRGSSGRTVRRYDRLDWYPGEYEHQLYRLDTDDRGEDALTAAITEAGRNAEQHVEVTLTKAEARIAEHLHLDTEDTVVVRRRRIDIDGSGFLLADSYYPMDVAQGTPIMEPGDITIPGGLMQAAGHKQHQFLDELIPRMPRHEEAIRLEIPPMTPVAELLRVGYNADNRPVRVYLAVAPGDRVRILYRLSAQ